MFSLQILNRFRDGGVIATELPSSSNENRRWVAIYHAMPSVLRNLPEHKYSIYDFEINKNKLEENFGPADIVNNKRYFVNSKEELFSVLNKLEIDPSLFTYPWKCDFPL